jgi:DNA polymerase III delta prime subunit
MNINEFNWISKYSPTEVSDLIATDAMKADIQKIIDSGRGPNMLFVGPPGIGKTTIAKLLADKLGADSTIINASLKGNIDTLRNEVSQFAGTVSLSGAHKYVILDEADYLNPQSTQPALRNFIDTFTSNCGFFLTANYGNRIIEPLRKRLEVHTFKIAKSDLPKLVMLMTKRCEEILKRENIPYELPALAKFVASLAPDWRSVLIQLQKYSRTGAIDVGILGQARSVKIEELVPMLKQKDFVSIRKWVAENADNASQELFTDIVAVLEQVVAEPALPALYICIARYAYQSAFVADQTINFAAALAEIMMECPITR